MFVKFKSGGEGFLWNLNNVHLITLAGDKIILAHDKGSDRVSFANDAKALVAYSKLIEGLVAKKGYLEV